MWGILTYPIALDYRLKLQTIMSLWHRPKTSDGNLLTPGRKVSFSNSSKSSNKRDSGRPSTASNSRPPSPAPAAPQRRVTSQQRTSSSTRASSQHIWGDNRNLQRINRQSEALWQYVTFEAPCAPSPTDHMEDPPSYLLQPHSPNLFSSITTPSFHYSGPIRLFNF